MFTTNDRRALLLSMILAPVLFVICSALAYAQRGYFAIGGEFGALLLPLYVALFNLARHSD
jgi:hypothetical protein